jgi:hypothetical protein
MCKNMQKILKYVAGNMLYLSTKYVAKTPETNMPNMSKSVPCHEYANASSTK